MYILIDLLYFFIIDEKITFNWDLGGKKVFLKIFYMPSEDKHMGDLKVREFYFPMSKKNYYSFEYKLSLKTLLKKFLECNQEFSTNSNQKYEEHKPCQDQSRVLNTELQAFRTIEYTFEVDGKEQINQNDCITN